MTNPSEIGNLGGQSSATCVFLFLAVFGWFSLIVGSLL